MMAIFVTHIAVRSDRRYLIVCQ